MDALTSIPVDALSSPGGLALSLTALVTSVAYALRSLGGANARSLDAITKSIATLERELGETKKKHTDCEEKHTKLSEQLAAQRKEIDGLRQSIASTAPTRCEDCGARVAAKETPAVRARGDHR